MPKVTIYDDDDGGGGGGRGAENWTIARDL